MPPSDSWTARVGAMSEPNAKVSKPVDAVNPKKNFQVKSQEVLLKDSDGPGRRDPHQQNRGDLG